MSSMDFVVNDAARSLRAGRTRTLGVITLDLSNPFWGEVVRGIESTLLPLGYSILLGSSEEDPARERQLIRLFQEHRVDGLLVASVDPTAPTIQELSNRGIRTVLLDQLDRTGNHAGVTYDQAGGTSLAARELLEQGHRRIAFIHSNPMSWSKERLRGVHEGVETFGLDPDEVVVEVVVSTMTAPAAEPVVSSIVTHQPPITAIIAANDMIALGVLKQLHEHGLRVPEDMSLIGFDDSYFAALLSPGLTTVRQQPFELGRRAAELAIVEGGAHDQIVFPAELVVRQSVRPPAGLR
jgi:LacI family transcriptional regulator